jgi:hypothetical protein
MQAIKVAQDLGLAWDSASQERRRQLVGELFESVTIKAQTIVAVRPRPELAPLLAAKVHSGGPDRSRTRQCLPLASPSRAWTSSRSSILVTRKTY